jgi:AcrR family transcriptional regulator
LDTRERILDAAAQVIGSIGLARATTKKIAEAAGCSEAALYKHFRDKEELFVQVLEHRGPRLIPLLAALNGQVGRATVVRNLKEVAVAADHFFRQSLPMVASVFAEPTLLAAHRESLRRMGAGPQLANAAVTAYVRAEQALGRIPASVDGEAVAALLLGACFQRAFLWHYAGQVSHGDSEAFADALLRTLEPALAGARARGASVKASVGGTVLSGRGKPRG